MTLIVTDSNGNRYRPTGCFREPEPMEFVYCFDHKQVEQRFAGSGIYWCNYGHPEFMLHRIICEPVPVTYEVRVRLTQEEFDDLDHERPATDTKLYSLRAAIWDAIRNGAYTEVTDDNA